jgi:hypothetical protein
MVRMSVGDEDRRGNALVDSSQPVAAAIDADASIAT